MFETFLNGLWADRYLIAASLAAALSVAAFYPYIRDTLRGDTTPDRACWLIWSVLASISAASTIYEGAGASVVFLASQVVGTVTVFALSITYGSGAFLSRNNLVILSVAGCGLISWALMETAAYALALSIGISALGGATTVWKAFRAPGSESMSAWALLLVAAGFGLYSTGSFAPLLIAYPLYLVVLYGAILAAQAAGRAREVRLAEEAAWQARRMRQPVLRATVLARPDRAVALSEGAEAAFAQAA